MIDRRSPLLRPKALVSKDRAQPFLRSSRARKRGASGLSLYLVSRESSDQGLLERDQPMVCPNETLVQQFRVGGSLGIHGLQLEHDHIS